MKLPCHLNLFQDTNVGNLKIELGSVNLSTVCTNRSESKCDSAYLLAFGDVFDVRIDPRAHTATMIW